MTDEAKVKELEDFVKDIQVHPALKEKVEGLTSTAGDVGAEFIDRVFTMLYVWVDNKLEDGLVKMLVLSQIQVLHVVVRNLVKHAL